MSGCPVLDPAGAVAAAQELAALFAKDSAARDAERITPFQEVKALKESGLLAITVPHEYGGVNIFETTLHLNCPAGTESAN